MKTLLHRLMLLAWLLALSLTLQAQGIPNGGMETWVPRGTLESPDGWYSSDELYGSQGVPLALGTVTKSTDKQAGSFAARIESKTYFGAAFPALLLLGNRFRPSTYGISGVPYSGRPRELRFWYKLSTATNDTAGVYIVLTRGGGNAIQLIAGYADVLPPRTSYGQVSLPLGYISAATPDTLRLFFVAGNGQATGTSTLYVDEVSLQGTVSATAPPRFQEALSIYPNPGAGGEFNLASLAEPTVATAAFDVTDAAGRVVAQAPAVPLAQASGRHIELHGQPAGVYLLRLSTPEGLLVRKLLIP
ncbi:T9SS type A sorting domain-containing protein [Hymenobacter metallilatus]|uniref:T9SS C-terminal target domain-containing protein n=1 Tax=Hymenobacter metallilatus TaxID=2493666 RepID=A0A428JRK9_9BACT|nr:T9SS type A sorting domain-containing protein [Hymenobacter metallilatus]RSK36229.1 T9SS C-terminal target domain-containing protein [Hymenobacter metallilatus]